MSNSKENNFEGWGVLGAIIGGLYGYALNENTGEAIFYAFAGYLTGQLVGFIVSAFLAWIILTIILLFAVSLLEERLKLFSNQSLFQKEEIHRNYSFENNLNEYQKSYCELSLSS